MPNVIVLHDFDNPANEIPVDTNSITKIESKATGKGSVVTCGNNSGNVTQMHVIELPEDIQKMRTASGHKGQWA